MMRKKMNDRGGVVEPRLVLVGGFLGAGKTTLISRVVAALGKEGFECGVVTNDQASGLVDTQLMESVGVDSVAEVAGGCFCCRLEELVGVLKDRWGGDAGSNTGPVVFAEPVGSCTDLMSTVVLPLTKVYQVPMRVAPLSVVVDGRRALASLGGRRIPGDFSRDVGYIYRKQLEEAEIVLINKSDRMETRDIEDLVRRLKEDDAEREVFVISARSGVGVDAWLERVLGGGANPRRLMEVDYTRYGVGEALLGWVNAKVEIMGGGAWDGDTCLLELGAAISRALEKCDCEVAHFKMALSDGSGRLGTMSQTMRGTMPELSKSFDGELTSGTLTVNLRAEADPGRLREIVESLLTTWSDRTAIRFRIREVAAFRPGQPEPTARVMEIV